MVNPFKLLVEVREACLFIISAGINNSHRICLGEDQKRGWINAKVIKLIIQNKKGEKLKRDVVAGSNEEKISTIIKDYQSGDIVCFEGK